MKKLLFSALAASLFLVACEDVPAPYGVYYSETPEGEETVETLPYSETFGTSLGSWTNCLTSGAGAWAINYSCATASGYSNGSTTAGEYFLVSAPISLADAATAHVSYEYILRYVRNQAYQQCLITNAWTGDAATTPWTVLTQTHTEGKNYTDFESHNITVPDSLMGDTVRVAFYYKCETSASTWEVKNFAIEATAGTETADGSKFSTNGSTPAGPNIEGEQKGSGTLEDPYNTAKALAIITSGQASSSKVYVMGRVCASPAPNIETSYGNATYYISADGSTTDQLEIYRGYSLGGNKFTSATEIQAGDSIIIYGQLVYFKNDTPEVTTGSSIVYLNGKTAESGNGGGTNDGDAITFDFAENVFNITTTKTVDAAEYTYGSYKLTLAGTTGNGYYYNSSSKYLILGKQGATLTLSGFTSSVAKIVITGRTGASAAVQQNIFCGDVAVSTATTGATGESTYVIANDYRNAGTYTLKVLSAHNTQVTKIEVYSDAEESGNGGNDNKVTYDFASGLPEGWTIENKTIDSNLSYVWTYSSQYSCMVATGYKSNARYDTESWLISPAVELESGTFSFNEAGNYFTTTDNFNKYATVKISTDDGATWGDLSITRGATGTNFTFADATATLGEYVDESVRIAFVYKSSASENLAGTWEIKNVTIY